MRGALLVAACGPLAVLLACAGSLPPSLAREHPRLWSDYRELPDERALAIAGDLRKEQWVAGASGGHDTAAAAEEAALRECAKRRAEQRMQAPCRVYAVGDEEVGRRR